MAKHSEYIVEPRADGKWSVKLPHAEKASAVKNTQREAIEKAKALAPEGNIQVKGKDGKFKKP